MDYREKVNELALNVEKEKAKSKLHQCSSTYPHIHQDTLPDRIISIGFKLWGKKKKSRPGREK